MTRFILILLALYVVWKIVKMFAKKLPLKGTQGENQKSSYPFDHVEEAEFKDLSSKKSDAKNS